MTPVLARFDPDEARAKDGRWGSGAGTEVDDAIEEAGHDVAGLDGGRHEPKLGASTVTVKHEVLEKINAKYPVAGVNEVLHTPSAMTAAKKVSTSDLTGIMTDLDTGTVKMYMAKLADGEALAPGLAVKIDGQTYVVDGNHRVDAQIRAGDKEVSLKFIKGVGDDAGS